MRARWLISGLMLTACGPVTVQQRGHEAEHRRDYPTAMADYQYEADHAPTDATQRAARADRDRAAASWIREQVDEAKRKLDAGDGEGAFGIVSSLSKIAHDWKIEKVDATLVQPAAATIVVALLPAKVPAALAASDPRAARQAAWQLVAMLDPAHAGPARAQAAALLHDAAEREAAAAVSASSAGQVAIAYLHRVEADAYAFTALTEPELAARAQAIDELARATFEVGGSTSCSYADGLYAARTSGRVVPVTIAIDTCRQASVDEVKHEQKKFTRLLSAPSSHDEVTAGHYEHIDYRNPDGSAGTGPQSTKYIPEHRTTVTDSLGETAEVMGDAEVHHETITLSVTGTLTAMGPDGSPIAVPLQFSQARVIERWQIVGETGPGTSGGDSWQDTHSAELSAIADAKAAGQAALVTLAGAWHAARGAQLERAGSVAGNPDAALDAYIASVRATGHATPPVATALEAAFHAPAAELEQLIMTGALARDAAPSYAFSLQAPALVVDATALAGTDLRNRYIAMRHPGGGFVVDGLIQPARSDTDAVGGRSKFGLGVGAGLGARFDPGPASSGLLAQVRWDLRLGYSNAAFADVSMQAGLGYRVAGIGVTLLAQIGVNKYGDSTEHLLYVNGAGYTGYGVEASLLTTGRYNVAAQYLTLGRSDRIAGESMLTLDDETRYEVRLVQFPEHPSGEVEPGLLLAARLSTFTGERPGGHIAALWIGFAVP